MAEDFFSIISRSFDIVVVSELFSPTRKQTAVHALLTR